MLFALVLSVGLLSCTDESGGRRPDPEPTQAAEPPNVLIFVTDDQRADTLSAMPLTQKRFADGTRFTRAYVTTPLCCPSRASIFSGRYSHNHGVLRNNAGGELDPRTMLPRYLQEAGYTTAIAGKYLQGIPVAKDPPNFHRWATYGWGYYDRLFNVDGKRKQIARYTTDQVGVFATRWIRSFQKNDDRPWFLYVATTAPHLPYLPEPDHADAEVRPLPGTAALDEEDLSDKPADIRAGTFSATEGADIYEGMMRSLISVDEMVDSVFGALDRFEETEDTLVVFTSDNGHLLGEHGLFAKRLPYPESVRVPLLLSWPSRDLPARDDRFAANVDIAATIYEAARISPEHELDGVSLLSEQQRNAILLEEYDNGSLPDWVSILTNEYQYTEYFDKQGSPVTFRELYDLVNDPDQLTNILSEETTPEADELQRLLRSVENCVGSECVIANAV